MKILINKLMNYFREGGKEHLGVCVVFLFASASACARNVPGNLLPAFSLAAFSFITEAGVLQHVLKHLAL